MGLVGRLLLTAALALEAYSLALRAPAYPDLPFLEHAVIGLLACLPLQMFRPHWLWRLASHLAVLGLAAIYWPKFISPLIVLAGVVELHVPGRNPSVKPDFSLPKRNKSKQ
jgi:hypothetical protein